MASIEWHPGFQAGLELRLRAYKGRLTYRHEFPLTKMPIVVDTLVIEKEEGLVIPDDVAAIFLRHNIVEYKSPDDALSIDEYYDLIAYMARYKARGGARTNEIKADQVTGTLMRQRKPEGLFREVLRLGGRIEQPFPGIYYIAGLIAMPTQIIVQSELNGPENAVLRILTRIANERDIRAFVDESTKYTDQDDRYNADAVYQVSVPANRTLYDHLRRREPEVCTALRELFKEEIDAEVREAAQQAAQQAAQEATQKGKKAGFMEAIIGIVKDGMITPEMGAERLHISVDEMKRLAALE